MRKIAYIASSRVPSRAANTVHVVNMSAALAGQGCEVTLFARGPAEAPDTLLRDFGIEEDIGLSLLPLGRNPLLDRLAFLRHLRRELRRGRFDFAYGRSSYALWGGVPGDIPFAYDLHVYPANSWQVRLEAMLFRRRNFLFATAISRALADKYEQTYPHLRGRILIAPCAATPVNVRPEQDRTGGRERPLRVYYVGHLYEGRGIDLILAVAALELEVEFHIVGGEDSDIARWAPQAPANVTFHGYVKPAELASHYAAADVCISPHQKKVLAAGGGDITNWMSPMKLFEYMAHGKPIVAADLPAIREVLTDGETALLCEPGNVEAWRRAVERLRTDPDLRVALGEAAFARLQSDYTWEGRARAVIERASAELERRR